MLVIGENDLSAWRRCWQPLCEAHLRPPEAKDTGPQARRRRELEGAILLVRNSLTSLGRQVFVSAAFSRRSFHLQTHLNSSFAVPLPSRCFFIANDDVENLVKCLFAVISGITMFLFSSPLILILTLPFFISQRGCGRYFRAGPRGLHQEWSYR